MSVLPNLIYIGPDKAASTWFFQLFRAHPEIFVTPAKDLYFFDRYYDKGLDWYLQQFEGAQGHRIVAEISHDYLISPIAAKRIRQLMPTTKLMVCLREPCDRAFSCYLHLVKSGHFSGSFEEAIETHPGLIQRSLYGRWIEMYLRHFCRSQLCFVTFDELKRDSQRCADDLCQQLGVSQFELPPELLDKVLPAGRSRSPRVTRLLKRGADFTREIGLPGLVGRVKSSQLTQRLLYVPFKAEERPQMPGRMKEKLGGLFRDDIAKLDELLGTNLGRQWGYETQYPLVTDASLQKVPHEILV